MFAPVDRRISLLAALFGLAGCAVQNFGSLLQMAPLLILDDGLFQAAFSSRQLHLMASLFLGLRLQTFHMALVLFGVYIALIGWLVYRSGFLPRTLGVPLMLAGLGWLTYLWPPLASALSYFVQPFGFLAEFLLMFCLLVLGVRGPRGRRRGALRKHTREIVMDLGAFSVSLAVKDIDASKDFYEKLGFTAFAGDQAQSWLIMKNGTHAIGLFQGMFERNILTFNPGWNSDAQPLGKFTDVRHLQRELKVRGVAMVSEADETSTGHGKFHARRSGRQPDSGGSARVERVEDQ